MVETVPPPQAPSTQIPVGRLPAEARAAWAGFGLLALAGLGASVVTSGRWIGFVGGMTYLLASLVTLARYQYTGRPDDPGVPVFLRRTNLPLGQFAFSIAMLYLGGAHPHPGDLLARGGWHATLTVLAVPAAGSALVVGPAARRRWPLRWLLLGAALAASLLTATWGLGLLWASF